MQTENFKHLTIAWKTEMRDNLMKTEINHDSTRGFNFGKNIWNPNLERHPARVHQVKFFPLPKESLFVEANKLIRRENADLLIRAKEERMIKRAIHNLEKSFSECRNSSKLSLIEFETLNKKKDYTLRPKCVYTFEKSKHRDSQNFLKNIHKIYKSIYCQTSNTNKPDDNVCFRSFDQSEKTVKTLRHKNLNKECRIFPYEGNMVKENMKTNGEKSSSSEFMANEPGSCACNVEQNRVYPSPKEESSNSNCEKDIILQNLKELKANSNFSYRFRLLRYWKAWRKFILRTRIDKEKLMRINKIDLFLKRLTKTVTDNVIEPKKLKLCTVTNPTGRKISPKKSINPGFMRETDKHLDKIEDELNKSAVEAYEQLQKGLKEFHPKLQPKVKALSALPKVDRKFYKNGIKKHYPIPSFLVRMDNRYRERKKRWEDIERRKREMQAEKEQIEKEREEERLRMEELKKKEKLEELIRKRAERKKAEEEREIRKQQIKTQIRLAQDHYKLYLTKRMGFEPWKSVVKMRYSQYQEAVSYSQMRTSKLHLKHWRNYTLLRITQKHTEADNVYNYNLLKRSLTLLIEDYNEKVKKLQVALDWWEAKLTEKVFTCWLRYTREERWDNIRKEEIAKSNFKRVITTKYLKKWKSFPEYMRSEKQKEIRKRLLQRRVQEFLPDYQPAYVTEM